MMVTIGIVINRPGEFSYELSRSHGRRYGLQ
jgi:hypothetical protein